jgi:hypothetical protein
MMERVIVLLLTGIALFAASTTRVRRSSPRERWILAAFGVPIAYLGLMYVMNGDWVNLHDLAHGSIGYIARLLVKWLEQT